MASTTKENQPTFREILNKAAGSAIRGGTAGAVAMGANVACLMWMRTTVSHKKELYLGSSFRVRVLVSPCLQLRCKKSTAFVNKEE